MKLFTKKKSTQRLDEILKGQEPPTFPQSVMSLLKLLRDPESEVGAIAEALNWDPGMIVRVLKTVNSAAFGAVRKIDSVPHAVSMMGRSQLEQLVLAIAVKGALPSAPAPGFESSRFWQAAFFRAGMARAIAERLHPADQARSFTGGLLQDMAIPLLAHTRPDDYGKVLMEWHGSPKVDLHTIEKEALGWSHDEVGGYLGTDWELPENLTSIIQGHHDNSATDAELPPALRLVALHRETEREFGIEAMIETAKTTYGLEADWLQETIASSEEQANDLSRTFG